jgi:hypothetical protein
MTESITLEIPEESVEGDFDLQHIVELCEPCWKTSDLWCKPGITLEVRCGRLHKVTRGVSDVGGADCIICIMSLAKYRCAHCGRSTREL